MPKVLQEHVRFADVPQSTSRRHVLAALAGASFAGGALVLAMPTEAPALGIEAGTDAALIALCAEYHRIRAEAASPFISDEWSDDLAEASQAALEQIARWTPHTFSGLRAKAGVGFAALLLEVDAMNFLTWREQASLAQIAAIEALRDLSGLPEPRKELRPVPESVTDRASRPHPDAALIQLSAKYREAEATYRRTCWAEDDMEERPGKAEALVVLQTALAERNAVGHAIIAAVPATLRGYHAKASAALADLGDHFHGRGMGESILYSMARDLVESEARP